jgi:hypothetical protein
MIAPETVDFTLNTYKSGQIKTFPGCMPLLSDAKIPFQFLNRAINRTFYAITDKRGENSSADGVASQSLCTYRRIT